jgi:Mg2+/Co2+ transporter CorB
LEQFSLSTLVITLGVLLAVAGFFSIAETSMMALNRYRLKHLVREGSRAARLTSELLERTDKLLGVILLGNNLINAGSAMLAAEISVRLIGRDELALAVATLAVTFFILVFSEITPKVIGASYPEKIALPSSFVLKPLLTLFYPVVWFVNLFVQALLKLLRIKPPREESSSQLSMEELRSLVLEGSRYIPSKHRNILLNLFELEDITVDDAMRPRQQIEAIDITAPIEEIIGQLATSHHTKLPVYDGQLDDIVGILHVRRVLHQTQSGDLTKELLRQIMRPPFFVPSGTPLLTQLQNFQENRRREGLVVDEYGELLGLVTLEDILEEIVGEFSSQSPTHGAPFKRLEDGAILVEGACLLRDLNKKLGLAFELNGPRTVNGLILERFESIPEPGTSLKIDGYPVEIVQTQDRMVKMAKIYPLQASLPLEAGLATASET